MPQQKGGLLTDTNSRSACTVKSESSEKKKGSFKSSEFKAADFPKDAGMGPEHKMAAATRQEMKKMGREKKPETSFYFLLPNQ